MEELESEPVVSADTLAATEGGGDPGASRRMDSPPSRVGHFALHGSLGSGGMGIVYEATDESLDRRVAIKLLHPDANDQARLLREAQAMARLSHPNVVQVYQVGEHGDQIFIAMELVEGETLARWTSAQPRSWQDVVSMYLEAGRGLVAAHEADMVHRDFKPENVLVSADGRPRVLDFGLARSRLDSEVEPVSPRSPIDPAASGRLLTTPLTQTGAIRGTPAYMAPEQHRGEEATAASDQFAFCVSLYEALCGRRPYAGDNLAALMVSIERGEIRDPPRDTKVPSWLFAALRRGLALDPADRFESMSALLRELGAYRDTDLRIASRARTFVVAASVFMLVLVFATVIIARRGFDREPSLEQSLLIYLGFTAIVGGAMFVVRKQITKSELNRRIMGCFLVYLFAGPTVFAVAWRAGLLLDGIFIVQMLVSTVAMAVFATAFDRRLWRPQWVMFAGVIAAIALPGWGLEVHALVHVIYFSWFAWIWARDGMPNAKPSPAAASRTNPSR